MLSFFYCVFELHLCLQIVCNFCCANVINTYYFTSTSSFFSSLIQLFSRILFSELKKKHFFLSRPSASILEQHTFFKQVRQKSIPSLTELLKPLKPIMPNLLPFGEWSVGSLKFMFELQYFVQLVMFFSRCLLYFKSHLKLWIYY